jgi:hypothetical protein
MAKRSLSCCCNDSAAGRSSHTARGRHGYAITADRCTPLLGGGESATRTRMVTWFGRTVGIGGGLFIAACSNAQHCVDQQCVDLPSNAGFYFRWVLFIALGAGALIALVSSIAQFSDDEPGTGIGLLVLTILAGNGAYWAYPGTTSPQTRAVEQLAVERGPQRQLDITRATYKKLEAHLDKKVRPLREKYQGEYEDYVSQLQNQLPKSKFLSHEDLLKHKDSELGLVNVLNRAAVLEHALRWLDKKLAEGDRTLKTLDQNAWRLEKLMEMNEVASKEEGDTVLKIVASAEALLTERITPPENQDVAEIEAKLFARILSEAARASNSADSVPAPSKRFLKPEVR